MLRKEIKIYQLVDYFLHLSLPHPNPLTKVHSNDSKENKSFPNPTHALRSRHVHQHIRRNRPRRSGRQKPTRHRRKLRDRTRKTHAAARPRTRTERRRHNNFHERRAPTGREGRRRCHCAHGQRARSNCQGGELARDFDEDVGGCGSAAEQAACDGLSDGGGETAADGADESGE
jgi:hypothetical protein